MNTTEQNLQVTVEPTGAERLSTNEPTYRVEFPDGRSMIPSPTAEELQALGLTPPLPPEPEDGFVVGVEYDGQMWRSVKAVIMPLGYCRWYRVGRMNRRPAMDVPDEFLTWERLHAEHGPLTIFTPTTGGN
jgi:hypothetical protein